MVKGLRSNNKGIPVMTSSGKTKIIAGTTGSAPTWTLPHGPGQGPKPDPNKHLKPLKQA